VEAPGDDGVGDALHADLRLSGMRVGNMFGQYHPLLGSIDRLLVEFPFHLQMLRNTWSTQHAITLLMGVLAVLAGAWDIGVGELAQGGDIDHVGISPLDPDSGISHAPSASVFLLLLGLGLFIAYLVLLWQHFPLMRSQSVYMLVAWLAVDVGLIAAHASAPGFPSGAPLAAWGMVVIGDMVLAFILVVMVHRPVIETRDLHVRERHGHPDPRVMVQAERDHSLGAWTAVIVAWAVLVNVSAWSAAHFVAPRPPFDDGRWIWYLLTLFSSIGVIALMMHILWYPQLMLGRAGEAIETRRAREISGRVEEVEELVRGICPDCGEEASVERTGDGHTSVSCPEEDCTGSGAPRSECGECGATIPSRIVCGSCGVSAPIDDHFGEEAW